MSKISKGLVSGSGLIIIGLAAARCLYINDEGGLYAKAH